VTVVERVLERQEDFMKRFAAVLLGAFAFHRWA
jgi:hypothetical protein